jgi:hypothetical protein
LTLHPRQNTIRSLTVEDLLNEIVRARAVLDKAKDDVTRLTEYIGALELAAKLKDPSLTRKRIDSIVSSVQLQGSTKVSSATLRAAGRATRGGEAQRLLYEKDMTIAKLAEQLGEGRARVSKWFGTAEENRPIPRKYAEQLLKDYGIPLSAWSRIAD